MRYFFEIAYHGKNYAGWQIQANATGVQQVVEEVLSQLFREPVRIVGSGRTDTGVHCRQQFFHADIGKPFDIEKLPVKLNSFLPRDIVIRSIRQVRETASARYSAHERSYDYLITKRKDPFLEGLAWHYFKSLDVKTMNAAAALLVGMHDFQCFSKVKTDVNHFMCDVKSAIWKEKRDSLTFHITANRFLRGMVRAVVGTLIDVGTGKTTLREFTQILESKDRRRAGANVPAYGLYLTKVKYPSSIFLN